MKCHIDMIYWITSAASIMQVHRSWNWHAEIIRKLIRPLWMIWMIHIIFCQCYCHINLSETSSSTGFSAVTIMWLYYFFLSVWLAFNYISVLIFSLSLSVLSHSIRFSYVALIIGKSSAMSYYENVVRLPIYVDVSADKWNINTQCQVRFRLSSEMCVITVNIVQYVRRFQK